MKSRSNRNAHAKSTRAKPPLESVIQAQSLKVLRTFRDLGKLMVVRTNSGKIAGKYDATEPGMSDCILAIRGTVVFLEFKRPGESQTQEQQDFQKECRRSGNRYEIATSVEDVYALLREFDVMR